MKNETDKPKANKAFTCLGVLVETRDAYRQFANARNRGISDVADAAFKAFAMLPRDKQDALLEGRELESASA